MADAKQEINSGVSQSRVVLAKPRLGGFGSSSFAASTSGKNSNPLGSVLRPSQLKPENNPFVKVTDSADNENEGEKQKEKNMDTETPKFVPLETNTAPRTNNPVPAPAQPATSSAGFVFGQNLSERVVMKENMSNGDVQSEEHSATNGTSEMLFTSAAASVKDNNLEEQSTSESNSSEGLAAAAAEYERSHARPPPPAAYCTMTGEEEETNVLQISCRLFAWESGSWRERGRGVLRLNETTDGGARLVARVAGSLRVVLNTKLWPEMVLERAGLKSLRITAADAQQQVKLFLIMGAPGDIAQLHRALMARVAGSRRTNVDETKHHSSQKAAERLDADAREENEEGLQSDYSNVDNEDTIHVNAETTDDQDIDAIKNNRLEIDSKEKFDMEESSVDNEINENNEANEDKDSKSLKRKEPAEDETSPKRQCPEISIQ